VLHEGYVGLDGDDERMTGTVANVIIPGHGASFRPGTPGTPA